ncbi:MAG: NAD-dependent epimerase/dehydratase family protein [Planctomycetes bacterium]|nr:NAD-dependent epimerase/dehydratase family protein [Planctomycetota bacterium]
MPFWLGRKVALTGASGFVGLHAARELHSRGADVVALVRETSDVSHLRAAGIACQTTSLDVDRMRHCLAGTDVVIHAAGAVGFGVEWEPYYRVNVLGTKNVLEASRRAGVRRLVHVSSIVAVGALDTPTPLDETAPWNLGVHRVPYVTTKRWAEDAALTANGAAMEVVVVNPASVIGPDDFTESEFGTLLRRFWKGRLLFHFGGGNNFVDVRDVALGIRLAAERGRAGHRYLLAGDNRAYHAFFAELTRAAGRSIPRFCLPSALAPLIGYWEERKQKRGRPILSSAQAALMGLYFFFDASKACRELGFQARPLRQTLADAHAFWMTPSAAA